MSIERMDLGACVVIAVLGVVGCGGGAAPPSDAGIGPMSDAGDAFVPPMDAPRPTPVEPAPIDLVCTVVYPTARSIREIVIDSDDGFVVLGTLDLSADLDPGPATDMYTLEVQGTPQSFVARFDASCHYQWTRVFDHRLVLVDLELDTTGEIVIAGVGSFGSVTGPVDFDPTPGTDPHPSNAPTFVTRLGRDGHYVGTTTRDCSVLQCPTGAAGTDSIAIGADGTVYVTTSSDLARFDATGSATWPTRAADAGVPVGGPLAIAPDGTLWVVSSLVNHHDWNGGIDEPGCPGGGLGYGCHVLTRVAQDGSYGGALVSKPGPLADAMRLDALGNIYLAGQFTGAEPDFSYLAPVERRHAPALAHYTMRMAADGTFAWATVLQATPDSTGGTGVVELHDVAIDRDEGVLYTVGGVGGIFLGLPLPPQPLTSTGSWIFAQDLDGGSLWAAWGDGLNTIDRLAAARGRITLAGSLRGGDADIDITPDGEQHITTTDVATLLEVYTRETCHPGDTLPFACPPSGGTIDCVGGRYGAQHCAGAELRDLNRSCLTCAELTPTAIACGTHDDGCGTSLACGGCVAPLACMAPDRTCRGTMPAGPIATGLDHPTWQMALDATYVYVGVAGDFVDGAAPPLVSVVRAARDGSGTPSTIAMVGDTSQFDVSPTHLYVSELRDGTFWRVALDGTSAPEVLATGLATPTRPVVDGTSYVYYSAALPLRPTTYSVYQYDQATGMIAALPIPGTDQLHPTTIDASYVWATSHDRAPAMYRWPRAAGSVPVPELVPIPPMAISSWLAPGRGYFDGTSAWTIVPGDRRRHAWDGGVLYGTALAVTGLNHVTGLAGDASGLFASVAGDTARSTTTGEIVRIW